MKNKLGPTARAVPRALLLSALLACTGIHAEVPMSELPLEPNILASPTLGASPGGFVSWEALFEEQERLNTAADRIVRDASASAQLAGIIAAPDERRLQVFWKGELSQGTQALLAELRDEVSITVQPAAFSRSELWAASRRVLGERHVLAAMPKIDGSGLTVELNEATAEQSDVTVLQARVASLGIAHPVSYTFGSPAVSIHSRDYSVSPVHSGARVYIPQSKQWCSTGIPVERSGATGWLISQHCGATNAAVYNTRAGSDKQGSLLVGYIREGNSDHDVAFLAASTGVAPRVYVGRPYGHDAAVPVAGTVSNYVGNIVFNSGSSTGLTGPLRVTAVEDSYTVTYSQCVTPLQRGCIYEDRTTTYKNMVLAKHMRGIAAVGHGDSGGVAFSFGADGRAKVRGTTSRMTGTKVPCPSEHRVGVDQYGLTTCMDTVVFSNIESTLQRTIATSVLVGSWK